MGAISGGSDVASTAGFSPSQIQGGAGSFLSALQALGGNNLSGLNGLDLGALSGLSSNPANYTPWGSSDPGSSGPFSGSGPLNGFWNDANAAYRPPASQASTPGLGSAGSAAPSLGDVLSALVGPAPTAPTGADFGAAPTLADFFSADPYNKALGQLASGKTAAAGTINSAYTTAAKQLAQIASTASTSTNQALGAAKADSQNAVSTLNNLAAGANAQAGAGGQVQARMAALQGVLGGQNAAQQALDNQLASVQKQNQADNASSLTSSQQNANNFLASQVLGQQNRIGLAESQDQARGQQMLAAANNARGASMARAQSQYGSQQKAYTDAVTKYMGIASKALSNQLPQGGADWAKGQEAQWAQAGAHGDQNAAGIVSAINHVIAPIQSGGQTKPPTYQEALTQMYGNASQMGGVDSPEFGIVANWLKNYYGVQKNGQLGGQQAPSQDQLAQYLYNTYLGGGR